MVVLYFLQVQRQVLKTFCYNLVVLYFLKSRIRYSTQTVKLWFYCLFFKSRVRYCVRSVKLRCSVLSSSPPLVIVHSMLHCYTLLVLYFLSVKGQVLQGEWFFLPPQNFHMCQNTGKERVLYWPPSEIIMSSTCYPQKYQSQELATLKLTFFGGWQIWDLFKVQCQVM